MCSERIENGELRMENESEKWKVKSENQKQITNTPITNNQYTNLTVNGKRYAV
jgi:hypothetical protein